ncbi:ABC transporter ATP-binding protein/permease [Rhizobium straminoryzae]|uniref:ABC transporter ATP-binding protein/permease n=1 Tax=Rhizobium straminoryzae TaxID=1387186 RepID=A0A549TAB3_9HYPH|nr:ABC transporter ATP-binding protein/permease [Rhizobium straminoryzae]TRL38808.1 ABC transporter ATP-binding protein/permease [Rhizobium straminoryzae]
MAETNQDGGKATEFDIDSADFRFDAQLRLMMGAFWQSAVRNRVLLLTVALLAVILTTVYAQYRLNYWNTPFYNALERRDLPAFLSELKVFFVIAGSLLILNVVQAWLNQMTALYMREGLARDLVDQWMAPRRALKLANLGTIGINPDQRLHEDARNLAELSTSLAIGLVNSTILLLSFIGVLWSISSDFSFTIDGRQIAIPGYMVWAALLYAASASLLSNMVGRRLPGLNTLRYSKEAELRFALMRTNENLMAITVTHGEDSERRRMQAAVTEVLAVIRRLALGYTNLTWVSSGFGWLTTIAPILIAAPVYFSGSISFGGLMMAIGAFNQVNTALRWYIDNFRPIADWKAALYRVSVFRRALCQIGQEEAEDKAPALLTASPESRIVLGDLVLLPGPGGRDSDKGMELAGEVTISPGDRVMFNGDPRANRHLLFLAMAGLWPWGTGEIRMPSADTVLFMPQKGYFPDASLREVMAYPNKASEFSDEQLRAALSAAGLDRLAGHLDARERWDRTLEEEERTRLRLASALLIQPDWLIIDDALESLDAEAQQDCVELLGTLRNTAIVYIGRSDVFTRLQPRIVHLTPLHTS